MTDLLACCAPLASAALSPDHAEILARRFKALGDPVRLRLLSMIASHEGGEACVCDLTGHFEVSGPTISHHLKVLREAGLIDGERRGTWVYYRAQPDSLRALSDTLVPSGAGPGVTRPTGARGHDSITSVGPRDAVIHH